MMMGSALRRLALAGLAGVALCAAGCGKQETPSSGSTAASNALAAAETFAERLQAGGRQDGSRVEDVEEFARRAHVEAAVAEILGGDDVLSATEVSNRLSGLDTEELTRVLVQTEYPRNHFVARARNMMQAYEEVLQRGSPPWTRLMAMSVLMDYYCYHRGKSSGTRDGFERVRTLAHALRPEDAPDKASQRTFASIAIDLCFVLPDKAILPYID